MAPCINICRDSGQDLARRARAIAIDRGTATQLARQLEGGGFELVAFGQGYASMNSPTKKLEQIPLSGQLAHGGNPVLRWMANNVSLETATAVNRRAISPYAGGHRRPLSELSDDPAPQIVIWTTGLPRPP